MEENIAESTAILWWGRGQVSVALSPPHTDRVRNEEGLHLYATSAYFLNINRGIKRWRGG